MPSACYPLQPLCCIAKLSNIAICCKISDLSGQNYLAPREPIVPIRVFCSPDVSSTACESGGLGHTLTPDRRALPLAGEEKIEKIRSVRNRLVRTERAKCGCVRGGFWRGNFGPIRCIAALCSAQNLAHSAGNCRRKIFPVKLPAVIDSAILLPAPIYTPIRQSLTRRF